MKYVVCLICFTLLLSLGFECQGQCVIVKTDTVNAIIIHKYTKSNDYYCVAHTLMVIGNDSLLFFTDAQHNIGLIKKYPFLAKDIGNPSDYSYDVFFDAVNHIFKHNLSFSEYNNLKNPYLNSISLYSKVNTDTIYFSIYNFYGSVNFYEGIKSEVQEISEFDIGEDCPCINLETLKIDNTSFAVLKETFELTSLSYTQETELDFRKSSVDKLNVLICE